VRVYRQARGLTQQALADAAGVGQDTVAKVEGGHYASGMRVTGALATALHQPLVVLPGAGE
jgi:DNA-binding XRE family transcriptional regulator